MKKKCLNFFLIVCSCYQIMAQVEPKPFITSWSVTNGDEIIIPVNTSFTYDFDYIWKDGTGSVIASASEVTGDIEQSFTTTGTVTLEITGAFPHFRNYPKGKLLDVLQWGDIAWQSFATSFQNWGGIDFSATDEPAMDLVTNVSSMFREARVFNGDIGSWKVGSVTSMNRTFNNADAFNQDLNEWDVSNVTNMGDMFLNADIFNGDLSNWNVANVKNMAGMFADAKAFNGDLSAWDVGKVTSLRAMFIRARNFQSDLSGWDVANVTEMNNLFERADVFNSDLSDWDVSKVKNMANMFSNALAFNADISSWDVSKVENMQNMFADALNFQSDLSAWDVANVTKMNRMFEKVQAFDADLSAWDVSNVTTMTSMFDRSGFSPQNYDKALIAWSALPGLQMNVSLGALGISFCKAGDAKATLEGLGWSITDAGSFCLDETAILSAAFATQTGDALIDADNQTVTVEVLFTNVLDTLASIVTLSPGATSDPASGEEVDFSSPVTYTVTAEDGITTQEWIISVTLAPPSVETDMLSFECAEQTGDAIINTADHTVAVEVALGTTISALVPTFTLSLGATSNPASGIVQDFTSPATYTITAQDGATTQDWTIVVSEAPNTETNILTFELSEQTGVAAINTTDHIVAIEVAFGTEVSALAPSFTLSEGAASNPASGVAQDFTSPVTYTISAEDGMATQDWTVTVTAQEERVLGLEESPGLLVYPNPVREVLHVETKEVIQVSLTSLDGKAILATQEGSSFKMDLSQVKTGVYLLVIRSEAGVITRKIVSNN